MNERSTLLDDPFPVTRGGGGVPLVDIRHTNDRKPTDLGPLLPALISLAIVRLIDVDTITSYHLSKELNRTTLDELN